MTIVIKYLATLCFRDPCEGFVHFVTGFDNAKEMPGVQIGIFVRCFVFWPDFFSGANAGAVGGVGEQGLRNLFYSFSVLPGAGLKG